MDEEIRFHIDQETELHRSAGVSEDEARRRGMVAFGGVERTKEEVRDARGTRLVEDGLGDVGWSLRALRRSPRFAIGAILTLAIGIGGTTAVFSAVNAVLLEPLPYAESGQLVRLYQYFPHDPDARTFVTGPHFRSYQRDLALLHGVAASFTYSENGADIGGADGVSRIRILPVSATYFDVLGTAPSLGRAFEARDETGAPDVILSHRLWMREFSGDPAAVGRTLTMDGVPYTVYGVMPDGFVDPVVGDITAADATGAIDAWVPLDLGGQRMDPGNHFLTVVARLTPGTSLGRAQAELDALGKNLAREYSEVDEVRAVLVPLKEDLVGSSSRALQLMLGAVGLVLLLVCVNIANLMLVRSSERAREFALRSALGAARGRLVRQLFAESVTLALAGAVAGLVVALGVMKLLVTFGAESIPRLASLSLDPRVLAFSLAAATASALIFGLVPARRAGRAQPADVLREYALSTTGSGTQGRLRSALVVAQVALAFVLLAGAGILLASLQQLRETPLGVRSANVLTFELNLPAARYDSTARAAAYEEVAARVAQLPGVEHAGGVSRLPATGEYNTWSVRALSGPLAGGKPMPAEQRIISGDYFGALEIPLVAGRVFDQRDGPDSPRRVVVSSTLAERLFPGIDPLGQRLHFPGADAEVIGVVSDAAVGPDGRTSPYVYHAHAQFAGDRNWALTQVVSTSVPSATIETPVRQAIAAFDPQLVMYRMATLNEVIGRGSAQRLVTLRVLGAFAAVALALAALGLFSVLSYTVKLRSREMGIRMALGADGSSIRGLVLRQGLGLAAIGIIIGLAGTIASSRLLSSLVFQVSPLDPRVLVASAVLMAAVAALAAYLPARKATMLEPRSVLQGE